MPGGVRIYPASDLIEWLGCASNQMTAELCGVGHGAVSGWKSRDTRFTEREAEAYAGRLGAHPCEIWGELWWSAVPEAV